MTFTLTIKNCKKLKVGDVVSSDPYIIVEVNGNKFQTKTIKNTLNPEFNETFTFADVKVGDLCQMVVWDYDKKSKDDKLGEINFPIEATPAGKVEKELKWDTKGSVTLEYFYEPPKPVVYPEQQEHHAKQIEEWTSTKFKEIIFDSDVDNWDKDTSVFDKKVLNKDNLAIVVEEKRGNIFGQFLYAPMNSIVYLQNNRYTNFIRDPHTFVFSLESKGRLEGPMKFDIQDNFASYAFMLYGSGEDILFALGYNEVIIQKKKNYDFCMVKQNTFDYQGKCQALVGPCDGYMDSFTVKRIQVWQMKDTEESKKLKEQWEREERERFYD